MAALRTVRCERWEIDRPRPQGVRGVEMAPGDQVGREGVQRVDGVKRRSQAKGDCVGGGRRIWHDRALDFYPAEVSVRICGDCMGRREVSGGDFCSATTRTAHKDSRIRAKGL